MDRMRRQDGQDKEVKRDDEGEAVSDFKSEI